MRVRMRQNMLPSQVSVLLVTSCLMKIAIIFSSWKAHTREVVRDGAHSERAEGLAQSEDCGGMHGTAAESAVPTREGKTNIRGGISAWAHKAGTRVHTLRHSTG